MLSKQKLATMKYLKREYNKLENDPYLMNLGCTIVLVNNAYFHWKISLKGPQDSPYEGGNFFLTADFTEDYPKSKPEIIFCSKIYNLNISPSNGHINIRKFNNWKPGTSMLDIISDIFSLFYKQNPSCPYSLEMAIEYKNNRSKFDRKAKEWTQKYTSVNN